jgi:hypothetical protein
MADLTFLFGDAARSTFGWLLPRMTRAEDRTSMGRAFQVDDFRHVNRMIGLRRALASALEDSSLGEQAELSPEANGILLNAITLFALAIEILGDRERALAWWKSPTSLPGHAASRAPLD